MPAHLLIELTPENEIDLIERHVKLDRMSNKEKYIY